MICQHSKLQSECTHSTSDRPCLTEGDLKYKMLRVSLESVDLFLTEAECAASIKVRVLKLFWISISCCIG